MKIPELISEELENSGVPFEIKKGGRHHKIFVGGALCGIIPTNGSFCNNRIALNVRAQIRRAIKKAKENGNQKTNAQSSRHQVHGRSLEKHHGGREGGQDQAHYAI